GSVGRRRERLPVGPGPDNIRSLDPDVDFTIVASAGDGMHILGRGNCFCLQLSYGTVIGIVAVNKIFAEFVPCGLGRSREGETSDRQDQQDTLHVSSPKKTWIVFSITSEKCSR